jgi:hypothetical protein
MTPLTADGIEALREATAGKPLRGLPGGRIHRVFLDVRIRGSGGCRRSRAEK